MKSTKPERKKKNCRAVRPLDHFPCQGARHIFLILLTGEEKDGTESRLCCLPASLTLCCCWSYRPGVGWGWWRLAVWSCLCCLIARLVLRCCRYFDRGGSGSVCYGVMSVLPTCQFSVALLPVLSTRGWGWVECTGWSHVYVARPLAILALHCCHFFMDGVTSMLQVCLLALRYVAAGF